MSSSFELIMPEHITREEIEALWAQEVDMDDWDYIIVIPEDRVMEKEDTDWKGNPRKILVPEDYNIERLLRGSDNRWYKATFRGKQVALGISYHA